ncbi:MAG: succinate dehydrogenase/fumarate reductase iron-sulfur subunit, partial [Chloroflexota bacterium]
MSDETWQVTFRVYRKKVDQPARFDTFKLQVNPDEYVLDAIERIWAFHDRSLTFRHACHHSTCGACGMRVNSIEKLTCITLLRDVATDGATVTIEPMRNFPILGDLVVDMGQFLRHMEAVHHPVTVLLDEAPDTSEETIYEDEDAPPELTRLVDCIECGLCMSACPVMLTDPDYLGPAVLAAAQ